MACWPLFFLFIHPSSSTRLMLTHCWVVGEPNKKPLYGLLVAVRGLSRSLVTLGLGCYDRTHQAYAGLVPRDDNLPFCATPSLRRSRTAPASGRLVTGDESAKATS